jgi:hypothetical protein
VSQRRCEPARRAARAEGSCTVAMAALGDPVERLPCSHSPLLSVPDRLAAVLERAARPLTDRTA